MEQGISLKVLADKLHNLEDVYGAVGTDCGYTLIVDMHLGELYYDLWNDEQLVLLDGEAAKLVAIDKDTYYYEVNGLGFELSQREFGLAVFS